MHFVFRLLILLVASSPLFFVADTTLSEGVQTAYVALMVFAIVAAIRPGEGAFLSSVIRPVVFVAAVPAIWMIVQLLPMPFASLQHPIWSSAQAALNRPLLGSVSISPGATVIALCRYLSAFGVVFVAAAVCVDRLRAETVLFCLAGITTLLALLVLVHDLFGFFFLGELSSTGPRASVTAAAGFGTVLTAATGVYAFERYETRRNRADFSIQLLIVTSIAATGGFAVCWLAIGFFSPSPATFAALTGVGTFALLVAFRRLGIGPRLGLIVAAVAIAVPISIIAKDVLTKGPDLTLRFDPTTSKSTVELTQRMIADTNWAGSGAGTFASLVSIYQDTGNSIVAIAPTTAAELLIEFGRPALWAAVIGAVIAIAWLIHGALQRGRDSFFTAAGAGCAVILLIEAFIDASLTETSTIIVVTTVLGLAISQSVSRTTRV